MARLRLDVVKARALEKGHENTKAISEASGVTVSTLNRLFAGTTGPTVDTLLALSLTYDIPQLADLAIADSPADQNAGVLRTIPAPRTEAVA
ncbi:helix-turn-helix domain protein [Actinobacteria bacterium OV450]|nr:helix-turn-helix domain protein [Actinobacteria bacterium OV450]